MKNIFFAGRDIASNSAYLRNQGKELGIGLKYPPFLDPLVKLYISLFGIPDIGYQRRFSFFQKSLQKITGSVFVDAGCGNGFYSRFVADNFPKGTVYSYDFSHDLIAFAKKISPQKNIKYAALDLTTKNLPFTGKADLVWCFDVLEHIKDYKSAVRNLDAMLKKGGHLLIHVPQPAQRRWFDSLKAWEHDTHEHEGIAKKDLLALLKNYEIIELRPTFGSFGSWIWEINMVLFKAFPPLGAFMFPFWRMLLFLDPIIPSKKYNCLGLFARKK